MTDNESRKDDTPGRKGPPNLTLVSPSGSEQTCGEGEGEGVDVSIAGADDVGAAEASQDLDEGFALGNRVSSLRIVEALLFASPEPLSIEVLAKQLPDEDVTDLAAYLEELQKAYEGRGINLVKVAGKWTFRTASDLSYLLQRHAVETRRLSKAALETLAIISYHQPVTRAEVEEIRGVSTSAGTLDILLETGWVRLRGRRRAPGRPVTYGTTDGFLSHFGLESIKDLPGLGELKGAGLLDSSLPANFQMPAPSDVAALMPDELPLEDVDGEDDEVEDDSVDADVDGDAYRAADVGSDDEAASVPQSSTEEVASDDVDGNDLETSQTNSD